TTPEVHLFYPGSETTMYRPGSPENRNLVDFTSRDKHLEKIIEKMSDIRDNFPALVHGSYELISKNNNLTLFKRETSDETLYVALNNDDESQVVEIDGLSDDYQFNGLMHDHLVRVNDNGIFEVG